MEISCVLSQGRQQCQELDLKQGLFSLTSAHASVQASMAGTLKMLVARVGMHGAVQSTNLSALFQSASENRHWGISLSVLIWSLLSVPNLSEDCIYCLLYGKRYQGISSFVAVTEAAPPSSSLCKGAYCPLIPDGGTTEPTLSVQLAKSTLSDVSKSILQNWAGQSRVTFWSSSQSVPFCVSGSVFHRPQWNPCGYQ